MYLYCFCLKRQTEWSFLEICYWCIYYVCQNKYSSDMSSPPRGQTLEKTQQNYKSNTAASSPQTSFLASSLPSHPPPAVRMSVGLFAFPDVSWQEEAARLSSVRASDSHVSGLSQLPFLRSLGVSPTSLRTQPTIANLRKRLKEPLLW